MKDSEYQEHNICKNRRNYGDSPAYLNPLGFLAGNPQALVVGGSGIAYRIWIESNLLSELSDSFFIKKNIDFYDIFFKAEGRICALKMF